MSRQRLKPPKTPDATAAPGLPPEALEYESPSKAIIARRIPPLSRWINFMVFLLVAATLTAASLIEIDKIVTGKGKIVAEAPNILLQPFDQSIVESIDVRKGDLVVAGQVLARLNPTFSAADLAALEDQVGTLRATSDRLNAEIAGTTYPPDARVAQVVAAHATPALTTGPPPTTDFGTSDPYVALQALFFVERRGEYLSTLERFDQNINQLQFQIAGSEAQSSLFGERAALANELQDMRQELVDRGADNRMNMLVAIDTRLTLDGLKAEAESAVAQASRQMAAQVAERESFVQRWAVDNLRDLVETRRNLVQAEQAFSKARLQHELNVLTAPRDAVVLSVATVSAGSVVTSAETLIELVPMDVPLSVEMDIAGMDSGYVRTGDAVTIKFDTLPYLQYGMARGLVRSISADSFNPEAMVQNNDASLPTRPSLLYYKGYIGIEEFELLAPPPGFQMVPGMPVTVDVKVGTRSILSYFFNRILPVVHEGIREP